MHFDTFIHKFHCYSLFHDATAPSGPVPPHYRGFMITLRHTTHGRTPLDEWTARRKDLYLTTHNTHKRYSCPRRNSNPQYQQASKRPQTHALDHAATGSSFIPTGLLKFYAGIYCTEVERDVDIITPPTNHHVVCWMEPRHVLNLVSSLTLEGPCIIFAIYIYIQSNEIHNVVALIKFFIST